MLSLNYMLFNMNFKKLLGIVVIIVLLGLGSSAGYYLGYQDAKTRFVNEFFTQGASGDLKNLDFTLFWDAWQTLKDKFIDRTKFDSQKMLYGAIAGMVKSLDDPYTIFMNPDDSKKFLEDVTGKFEGVGMEIGQKKGQLQVISPLEGTPAQKAGIRAGDKITKINDEFTTDMSVDQAVSKIRGPKGTEVKLIIFRDGWSDTKEFKLTRAVIEIPSLKWEMKDGNIAYLKLYQFSEKAVSDFNKATIEILNSGAKKMVLDLRNNPGGYLEVSQNIASFFLEKNSVVTIEDYGGQKEPQKYLADGNPVFLDFPLVVLINEGSASAAEILAGSLRDNRGIKLIGQTSFGKGSVQELTSLTGGSTIKITVAKWLTPKGQSISDHGLEPDVKVEITDKDYQEDKDPQLDKALEIIKGMP